MISRAAPTADRRNLVSDTRGAVSIEFGLVIGLLIMIIVATVEFGRALAARSEMSHALGRVTRVVNLNSTTTTGAVVGMLEEYLDGYDERELDVDITQVSGTNFMEVSVEFPFMLSIPLMQDTEVMLRVATRAPMVSPIQ